MAESKAALDRLQGRLLRLAALFFCLGALALTLAPAARARSQQLTFEPVTWLALAVWLAGFFALESWLKRQLPHRDPYLLPLAALLSGWGLLTITRLSPTFSLRQSAWLVVALGLLALGLRLPDNLNFLRRYKYLWLTSGLLLTGLTLVFGTNPLGYGPRLWLGCCGFYLQPSEPLKLLLVIYLSAYLADRAPFFPLPGQTRPAVTRTLPNRLQSALFLPLLAPTLVMTGLALLLMLVQRDLGTASIFVFLYTVVVYLASGRRRILFTSLLTLGAAGAAGYVLYDVVRLRVDAWLNPWLDPSGRSYQIVQSLLAIAHGGVFGRGPGMGSPGLVPVAHSDFIFAALAEETGLAGALALLGLFALLALRSLRLASAAPDLFRRLLAAGLGAYFAGQAVLIIGGNIRLLPLTGVTLPFVSYGGSSLVVSFAGLLLLLKISAAVYAGEPSTPLPDRRPYLALAALLLGGLAAAALVTGWWSVYRGPDLLTRTDNARRTIADRMVTRGALLDRHQQPLVLSEGEPGELVRRSLHPALSPIIGYTHPVYGQSGLEASLDPTLRGTQGNPPLRIWWEHLLYGQPPPGLDVRLSLDLELQSLSDNLLTSQRAALVLLNAESGEILVMSSHPNFDPDRLDEDWPVLLQAEDAPLLNRAAQALYPLGSAAGPLLLGASAESGDTPELPILPAQDCAWPIQNEAGPVTWGALIASGCPTSVASLAGALGSAKILEVLEAAGLFDTLQIGLPVIAAAPPANSRPTQIIANVRTTPLHMALAAAALSSAGTRPQPLLVLDQRLQGGEWQTLTHLQEGQVVFSPRAASLTVAQLADPLLLTWHSLGTASENGLPGKTYTWYLGGTSAGWQGSPLALALVLEGLHPELALAAGTQVLQEAMQP